MRSPRLAWFLLLGIMATSRVAAASSGFAFVTPMTVERQAHTATQLADGTILIAGGYNSYPATLSSAEVYDPVAGVSHQVGSMNSRRYGHTATRLQSGAVLITGGSAFESGLQRSAELYDPGTGTFTPIPASLQAERFYHTATLLSNGKVLIAGGRGSSDVGGELFDPVSQTFSLTGGAVPNLYKHTATLLNDGRVLIVGGSNPAGPTAEALLYDPTTNLFNQTGSMSMTRYFHSATLLASGDVLVAGGEFGLARTTAEIYSVSAGTFSRTAGDLTFERAWQSAALVGGGKVLLAGGTLSGPDTVTTAELYDPVSQQFTRVWDLQMGRYNGVLLVLSSGDVMLFGGCFGTGPDALASVERFTAAPVAVAGPNQVVTPGVAVALNGSGSFDDDTVTSLLGYSWRLLSTPSGSAAALIGAHTISPTFTPDLAGRYVIQLTVVDQDGLESAPSLIVIVENPPPAANAGLDQLVLVSSVVTLTGTGTDPNGDALTYDWLLLVRPSGSTAGLSNPGLASTTFVADRPGTYVAQFRVTDYLGASAWDQVQVTAATATGYAEAQMQAAASIVGVLSRGAVTSSGNQNALLQHLSNAVTALGSGRTADARQQIQLALSRVDGCALRGTPDGNGPGRDWLTSCVSEAQVYPLLSEALAALMP